MKRILVTGSDGQLGMTLQELAPGYPDMEFSFTDKDNLDITQPTDVNRLFEEIKPHYCINCAAYTLVDHAEKNPEPAFKVNARAVGNLVKACIESKTILVHLSTDYVFDGTKEGGYLPGDPPNPLNVYGESKLEGELLIQKGLERFFIVRTSWLYSKQYGQNFYKTVLARAKAGESLVVTDSQLGCPTSSDNLAAYLLELIASGNTQFGIKHFTDGEAMTWYDFAARILEEEGYKDKIELRKGENYRTFTARPQNSILLSEPENF